MVSSFYSQYRNLSLNLLILRKTTGLDQKTFAAKCGLSRFKYLRAEGAHGNLTLKTIFRICETFNVEIEDLFKDPFNESLQIEKREKIHISSSRPDQVKEEKYLSRLNRNTLIRRIHLGYKQIRQMKMDAKTNFEVVVLKGDAIVAAGPQPHHLKEGDQLTLAFNPQLSFEENSREYFKIGSIRGAEVLLIQTVLQ